MNNYNQTKPSSGLKLGHNSQQQSQSQSQQQSQPQRQGSSSNIVSDSNNLLGQPRPQQSSNIEKVVRAQVYFILSTIREDQYDTKVRQLEQLISQNGGEIYLHFLRRLIIANSSRIPDIQRRPGSSQSVTSSLNSNSGFQSSTAFTSNRGSTLIGNASNSTAANDSTDSATIRLLTEQMYAISSLPSKAVQFGEAIAYADSDFFKNFNLIGFLRYFNLTPAQNIVLATSAALHENPDFAEQAEAIIKLNFHPFIEDLHKIQFMRNSEEANLVVQNLSPSQAQAVQKAMQNIEFPADLAFQRSSSLVSVIETNSYSDYKDPQKLTQLFQKSLSAMYKPTAFDVAQLIIYISVNCDLEKWKPETVIQALSNCCELKLSSVLDNIDCANFFLDNAKSLAIFLELLNCIARVTSERLSLKIVFRQWKNLKSQAALLEQLIMNMKIEDLDQLGLMDRPIIFPSDYEGATASVAARGREMLTSVFNSYDLVKTIIALVSTSAQSQCLRTLELALQTAPDLVFLEVLQQGEPWNETQEAIVTRCIKLFFHGNKGYLVTFFYMSKTCPEILISIFRDIWTSDHKLVSRLVTICQDCGILDILFSVTPLYFAFESVSYAAVRGLVNINHWLKQKYSSIELSEHKESFQIALMEFLSAKASAEASQNTAEAVQDFDGLRVDIVDAILQFLMSLNLTPSIEENLKYVRIACLQVYPRLFALGLGRDHLVIANTESRGFPPDVERQVENDYQRLYEHLLSVNDVVLRLQKLKTSENRLDLDVFSCMLHSLFDEYRFFADYPVSALAITAVLFGSLLQYGLLSSIPSAVALGYIYDSLLAPADQNIFRFGIQALIQFQHRLPQFPVFAQKVLTIPNLAITHPDIMNSINHIVQSRPMPAIIGEMGNKAESSFSSIVVDQLPHELSFYKQPDESIQDQILFAINNLSPANFDAKVHEISKTLKPPHYKWFSNYIVQKRVSFEPNFHSLYIKILDYLQDNDINKHIIYETIAGINGLLNSEKLKMSPGERSSLKNLGTWLGAITLARNKPIRHKNIAFKSLIVEAYYKDRITVVLPFVCKVLEQAAFSTIFKPTNPWLAGILQLLAELYLHADLKLNLKFEIEVLLRNLNVDIKSIRPSSLLKTQPVAQASSALDQQPSNQFKTNNKNNKTTTTTSNINYEGEVPEIRDMRSEEQSPPLETRIEQYLAEAVNKIHISPKNMFNQDVSMATMKKVIVMALGQSISDVVLPIVERATIIAVSASTELLLKDFAREGNVNMLRHAARECAQVFGKSLCMVNCKEPLHLSLISNIRELLLQIPSIDESMISVESVEQLASDNMAVALNIAESYADERTAADMDKALSVAYHERIRFAEMKPQDSIFEAGNWPATAKNIQAVLPELLRLEVGGLTNEQRKIYELLDYQKHNDMQLNTFPTIEHNDNASRPATDKSPVDTQNQPNVPSSLSKNTQLSKDSERDMIINILMEKAHHLLEQIRYQLLNCKYQNLKQLPVEHELQTALFALINIFSDLSLINRDDIMLYIAQSILAYLFSPKLRDSQLAIEIFTTSLDRMRSVSSVVSQFLIGYFLRSLDTIKLQVSVYVHLIQASFFSVSDLDSELAKQVSILNLPFVEFSINLIRETVLTNQPDALLSEFADTVEALKIIEIEKSDEESIPPVIRTNLASLMQEISPKLPSVQYLINKIEEDSDVMKEQFGYMFAEWIRLTQRTTEKRYYFAFVHQLHSTHILGNSKVWLFMLRVCFELSIDAYKKHIAMNNGNTNSQCYIPIDAVSKLIIMIMLYNDHETTPENPTSNDDVSNASQDLLKRSLFFATLMLSREHERPNGKEAFDQRLFCRFYSSIIWNLSNCDKQLARESAEAFQLDIAHCLLVLQPKLFPGFTFAWLSLISHPKLLPSLMEFEAGQNCVLEFIVVLLKFLDSLFRHPQTQTTISARLILKGFVRIVLVLSIDYPDIVTLNYLRLICHVPEECPQLCNIILTIAPSYTSVGSNPFLNSPALDSMPSAITEPPISCDFVERLSPELKTQIDQLLSSEMITKSNIKLVFDCYNDQLKNGSSPTELSTVFALYLTMYSVHQNKLQNISLISKFDPESPAVKIMHEMIQMSDVPQRHHLLNGIVNHLRYPNCHTIWCTKLFLHLWNNLESTDLSPQEQMARIILGRLIPHQPHPWGLLALFYFLLRDPSNQFWSKPFLVDNRQVRTVFESIQEHIIRGENPVSSIVTHNNQDIATATHA